QPAKDKILSNFLISTSGPLTCSAPFFSWGNYRKMNIH
ncbi:unnamed protein product, partial [Schistosoma curassoni]|uniref:Ovule protein n=1 Tax=Schistosoma curassoni TaxID=6186 RepID=A0A183L4C1_9TREM